MRRALAIIGLIASLAFAGAACSHPPGHGTVLQRGHHAAYSYWVPGIQIPETCSRVGNMTECSGGMYVPGHEEFVPESWSLKLHDSERNKTGWRDVDVTAYDSCSIGAYYPDCTRNR